MSNSNTVATTDETTPAQTPEAVGTFSFYVSDRIVELASGNVKQAQLTVGDAQVKELLDLAGLESETKLSRKGGFGLKLEILTPKGAVVPMIMADTHAIWFSHQRDKSAQKLVQYFAQTGGAFDLDLVSVEGVRLTSGKKAAKKATAQQMSDCPV